MRYEIGQLSIGQIMDQTFSLLRNHFKLFFGIIAIIYLPIVLIQGLVTMAMMPHPTGATSPEEAAAQVGSMMTALPIVMIFVALILIIIAPLSYAAMSYAVASEYLDKPTTVKESIGQAIGKIWPVLWTGILSGVLITLGLICFLIPGIYLMFRYYLVQQVVVLEDIKGSDALKRSGQLMKGNIGIAFVLGAVLWVISIALSWLSALIPIPIVQTLIGVIVQTVVFTIWCIAAVVLYFHCRSKNENYDLTLLAQEVGADDVDRQGPPPLPAAN